MRYTNKYLSLFLFVVLIPIEISAIENKFEYLTPEDGLSQGNVECIFQDQQGFMWFGTFNGLNRFDGYSVQVFNHDINDPNSLSHERVIGICGDDDGKLWLATHGGGVSVYYPEFNTFQRIGKVVIEDDTVFLQQMTAIKSDLDGNIWAIEEILGLFVFDKNLNLVKSYRNNPLKPNSIPASRYYDVEFDDTGNAWVGVGNGMLCKKPNDSDEFEVFLFESRVAAVDDGIRTMYTDRSGNIWIGTSSQGAYMFDPLDNSFINFRKDADTNTLSGNNVMTFAEDQEGNLLIGIDGGGINILDPVSETISSIQYNLGNSESLNTNAVYAIYFDRSGNLWVGTYAGGINFQSHYKNKFAKYIPDPMDPNSLSYKNVTSIMEDKDGDIWIGTDGGGINNFKPYTGYFEHYKADPSNPDWLQTDVVIHMMQDTDGDIYIASYNQGLTIFDKYTETFTQYLPEPYDPTSIAGMHPWYCLQDSYGSIWIGLLAVGLDKYDKETGSFSHYVSDVNDPKSLYSPNIKVLYEDKNRDFWVGTEGGGLHKYNRDDDNFTRYIYDPDIKTSISNNDIRAIYEDSKNQFWIGTASGFCQMDREQGTFTVITSDDGLPGNTINGILEDDEGFLWLSTNAGISKFNSGKMTFRNYDKTDGLQGNEFNYTASLLSSDGYFYFGGKNGFNMFRPGDIKDNPYPPPIAITQIGILNKSYFTLPIKDGRKTVDKSVSAINEFEFSYKQNVLTFEFVALDFGNSIKNEYRYMLEGFDKTWTYTNAAKRFATYTNLPGGDYILKIGASNGDGIWNEEGIQVNITITPPFWKRLWFILLVIAFIIWLVIRFIKTREEKLRSDKEILEQRIQEGLRELNKQKEEVALRDQTLQDKIEAEKMQNWYNEGMIKMSQVMSQKKDDLHMLSQGIITELVEYLQIAQGAIFILNDNDENDMHLVLQAAYAPDEERIEGKRIELREGQIGACYRQQEVIIVDNLPADYANLSSGLGDAPLKFLAVIPLKLNEICIGVIELIAFQEIESYKIEFVVKSGETLTSILTALKATDKTQTMFEQQKLQAEELSAQEEELRQNLEEMQATQEESSRKAEELIVVSKEFEQKEKDYIEKIKKLEKQVSGNKKSKK